MVSIYILEIAVMSHLNILTRHVLKVSKNTKKKTPDSDAICNNHLQSTRQKSYYYYASRSGTEISGNNLWLEFTEVATYQCKMQKSTPKPTAEGPPKLRSLSNGAQTATTDSPATTPAVYLKNKYEFDMPGLSHIRTRTL